MAVFEISLVDFILESSDIFEEVKKILEKRRSVGEREERGDTPLHAAALKGRMSIVNLLLQHGADPNVQNNAGSTPLHKAVVGGWIGVAKRLKLAGLHLDQPNHAGFSPEYYSQDLQLKKHA